MLGHDYCSDGYGDKFGVCGYGIILFEEDDKETFDLEKLLEIDYFLDDEDVNIHEIFEALSEDSKLLFHIDTMNTDEGAILMMPTILPWELNNDNRLITKEEINQKIIGLLTPYMNISENEILRWVGSISTGGFYDEDGYGNDLRGIAGYGLTLHKSDIELFNIEKLRNIVSPEEDEVEFYDLIENLSMRSSYLDCDYTRSFNEETLLYFKSRMPWEYNEQTSKLTKESIAKEIIDILLPYLKSIKNADYLRCEIDKISTCFYEG
jgi:hypothetical protein